MFIVQNMKMEKLLSITLSVFVHMCMRVECSTDCYPVSGTYRSCQCRTKDGFLVDLHKLFDWIPRRTPLFSATVAEMQYTYQPCIPYTQGTGCVNVAACQITSTPTPQQFAIGYPHLPGQAANFTGSVYANTLNITYIGQNRRVTVVMLRCSKKRYRFHSTGESAVLSKYFLMTLETKLVCLPQKNYKPSLSNIIIPTKMNNHDIADNSSVSEVSHSHSHQSENGHPEDLKRPSMDDDNNNQEEENRRNIFNYIYDPEEPNSNLNIIKHGNSFDNNNNLPKVWSERKSPLDNFNDIDREAIEMDKLVKDQAEIENMEKQAAEIEDMEKQAAEIEDMEKQAAVIQDITKNLKFISNDLKVPENVVRANDPVEDFFVPEI